MHSHTAKKLECDHVFHLNCIKQWVQDHDFCPVCRRQLIVQRTRDHQTNGRATGDRRPFGATWLNWLPQFSVQIVHGERAHIFGNVPFGQPNH